jgi:hypothetical protein
MAKTATITENYNRIRAGIVELPKTACAATARNVKFDHDRRVLGNRSANR